MKIIRQKVFSEVLTGSQVRVAKNLSQSISKDLAKSRNGQINREINNNAITLGKYLYKSKGTGQRKFNLGDLTIYYFGDKNKKPKSSAIDTQTSIDFGGLGLVNRKLGGKSIVTRKSRAILNSPDVATKTTRVAAINTKGLVTNNRSVNGAQTKIRQLPTQLAIRFK